MSFWRDPINFIIDWALGVLASTGLAQNWVTIISFVVGAFLLAAGAMFFVVFLIWYERKLIGRIQDRYGPNRVGPWGIFQPFADMAKIFAKEIIIPGGADVVPYLLAPV